jgi:hypothetical protein
MVCKAFGNSRFYVENGLVPTISEIFDEKKKGRRMLKIIDLNNMTFTTSELPINVNCIRDRIALESYNFSLLKATQSYSFGLGEEVSHYRQLKRGS